MHVYDDATEALVNRIAALCHARLSTPAPLDHGSSVEQLYAAVGETITREGIGHDAAATLWEQALAPSCISSDHPRFLAYIPGAPTKAAAAFDMLVGAQSIYGGSWVEGSGAVYAENQALRWISDLAGLPLGAGGVFVQGGTNGNLSALVAARHAKGVRGGAVVVSHETHSSVKHMVEVVMGAEIVSIPGDERGRLTGLAVRDWLASATAEERAQVFAVVATAGTTNLGVIDDLAGLADVAEEQDWWLHVDGAYGGAGLAAPSVRHLYAGIERADSFIVDPHKWLFSTFDCCALVYRDPALARAAHMQHAAYLETLNESAEWNPSDYAVHLSRRTRGLPFWFSLAVHGTQAYEDSIERTLAVTRVGRALIDEAEHVRLLVEPDLSVLIFERIGWDAEDYQRWSDALLAAGTAFVTPTSHRGRPCTRFAVVNPMTTADDLALILATMR